jgi:hypothetical protein
MSSYYCTEIKFVAKSLRIVVWRQTCGCQRNSLANSFRPVDNKLILLHYQIHCCGFNSKYFIHKILSSSQLFYVCNVDGFKMHIFFCW